MDGGIKSMAQRLFFRAQDCVPGKKGMCRTEGQREPRRQAKARKRVCGGGILKGENPCAGLQGWNPCTGAQERRPRKKTEACPPRGNHTISQRERKHAGPP